jgi:magnesium transporter
VDDYGDYLFIVLIALTGYESGQELITAEADFFLGPNYVVSCHQAPIPAIDAYHTRCLRDDNILGHRADWLLHGILDTTVDEFLPIVDAVDETIETLEAELLDHQDRALLEQILMVKRNTLRLRRATGPQRDIMNRLSRGEFDKLIAADTAIYFRDIHDHLVRMEYLVEAVRDLADGALTYLSGRIEPAERSDEGADRGGHHLPAANTHLRRLRDELRAQPVSAVQLIHRVRVILAGMIFFIAVGMTVFYKRRNWLQDAAHR